MSYFLTRLKSIFISRTNWKDDYKCPKQYKSFLETARKEAWRKLQLAGYTKNGHKIREVKVVKGTVLRKLGWSIPFAGSPTGYAGGYTYSCGIVLVCNPNNGEIRFEDAVHEWQHAILHWNGIHGDEDYEVSAMKKKPN